MEQLDGSSRIKELQLLRVGSASFEEIYPQTMLTLESHSELMHNLTKFELTISGRNEMDWQDEEDEIPSYRAVPRADRINVLLICMKQLTHLKLERSVSHDYVDAAGYETRWLHDVLAGLNFRHLHSIGLKHFMALEKTLHSLFTRHQKTLKCVSLEYLDIRNDAFVRILNTLRDELTLDKASIFVGREFGSTGNQYCRIVAKYESRLPPGGYNVDIGPYVIKPKPVLTMRDRVEA
jgi:hypothetical protein